MNNQKVHCSKQPVAVPGDVDLGCVEVLVVLEHGELLRVPERHGSHHVPDKCVKLHFKLKCCVTHGPW